MTEALAHELRGTRRMPRDGASPDPGLRLYGPDARPRRDREAGRRLDARADGRLHAGRARHAATSTSCARTTTWTGETDEKRIAWAAGDIIENRPALSRWDPLSSERIRGLYEGMRGRGDDRERA